MEHIDKGRNLALDLIFRTKNMGIVLGEASDAHNAVQRARGFVSVATAKLGEPKREVAVGLESLVEHLHVTRAVHRLHRKLAIIGVKGKHPGGKFVRVTRTLPQ